MGNFDSMNKYNQPEKAPITPAPVLDEQIKKEPVDEIITFDEQKEEDKILLQEYRILLEEEEDPVVQYALVEKIVDLEMKEYYEEEINIQEDETLSSITEPIEENNFKKDDVWEDLGNHKGINKKKFPHPTKSTKTIAEKEAAKKIAIEKALKKRRERDSHIEYRHPLDPGL